MTPLCGCGRWPGRIHKQNLDFFDRQLVKVSLWPVGVAVALLAIYLVSRSLGAAEVDHNVMNGRVELTVRGDHYQFYLEDIDSQPAASLPWDEQSSNDRL